MEAILIFGMKSHWTVLEIVVGLVCLALLFGFGFGGERFCWWISKPPCPVKVFGSILFVLPYTVIALADGIFEWRWFSVYAALPVGVCVALRLATKFDPEQRGTVLDYGVLLLLGLAVDLRWFEPAWPAHLHSIGKIVLLDVGLYGFLIIRGLTGSGIDFRSRWRDWKIGVRELVFYAPIAVGLGLWLGFLHFHGVLPPWYFPLAWLYTAVFIAIPEEIFFRGWMQNLVERRAGRIPALIITSVIFGLSHFNKKSAHFNWRYVLLAAIAGIFYGRAWRSDRHIAASVITHASVDTLWGIWLL